MKILKPILSRALLACTLFLITAAPISAQQYDKEPCYLFGFAASFADSTVYFTEIQQIADASLTKHSSLLFGREQYANQLRDYLQGIGFASPTCVVSFSVKKKNIENKYLKLKKRYTKNGNYLIKYLTPQDFAFKVQTPDPKLMIVNGGAKKKH